MTLVSESESSWKSRSVPSVLMILVFTWGSDWKARFISAQLPFNLSAASGFLVSSHRMSTAPDSTIGSLAGENSSSRLQMVEVTTVRSSFDGCPVKRDMRGRQTE